MHEKFDDLVSKWRDENVSAEMMNSTEEWLMGETDDMKPCETTPYKITEKEKSPYYQYQKYRVKFFKVSDKELDD